MGPSVVVLSYPRYCRYRAIMRRLEGVEDKWLKHSIVTALGGFSCTSQYTKVLFCKDTFDYPDLEGHELLCNHLAPKLKGRPRGKRKKRSISPGGSESNESESSRENNTSVKTRLTTSTRNGLRCNVPTTRRSARSQEHSEERDFMAKLNLFMKSHKTPIGRVPSIGYKEIDLFAFYNRVQKLGGYDNVTANRWWKPIFDEMGGHHNSTSAATIMRRHYERLLLAYERHLRGEEHRPLPASERRRLKSKTSSFSDAEMSEGDRSSSGHTTPVPSTNAPTSSSSTTPSTPTENKEFTIPEKSKTEVKTSSLRSVRVKPDRIRESKDKTSLKTREIPHTVTSNMSSLPENPSMPVTSAVAPVAEKPLEKSPSPLEGKENIPNIAEVSKVGNDSEDDLVEVPYKPPTPEIIDLDPEEEAEPKGGAYEVKKRKLDILKEGGLEVTAVSEKDRPSVIQHIVVPPTPNFRHEIGNLSITVSSDMKRMPPPQTQTQSKKPIYSINSIKDFKPRVPKTLLNGQSPPKVVQSKSIYSYSERTVYGNPKDPIMPPPAIPRHLIRSPQKSGGEVLDLTVKSPQKPIVEIMRVPNVSTLGSRAPKNPNLPGIEGRLGSNLEITLVSGKKVGNLAKAPSGGVKPPQKRGANGKGGYGKPYEQFRKNPNIVVPSMVKNETTNQFLSGGVYPPYGGQIPSPAKSIPNPYLPMIDPLYYSALCSQSLGYPPTSLASVPPLFPQAASMEQLQFFKDFMAHSSRGRFPFSMPQDGSMTITSVGQNENQNAKK